MAGLGDGVAAVGLVAGLTVAEEFGPLGWAVVGFRRCCCDANTCERLLCLCPPDLLANQRDGEAKAGSSEQPPCTLRPKHR